MKPLLILLAGASLAWPQDLNLGLRIPDVHLVRTPPLESFTLPNGLRVLLSENHDLPRVEGILVVDAGSRYDPAGRAGLSEMTLRVMAAGGYKELEGGAFTGRLAELGATLQPEVQPDYVALSFTVPSENLLPVLDLVRMVTTQPSFPVDSIEEVRAGLELRIGQRNSSAEEIADRVSRQLLFGPDSSYGRIQEYESLDGITREQLQEFHAKFYRPANALLALRGDFSSAGLRAGPGNLLGSWTGPPPANPEPETPKAPPATSVYLAPLRVTERTLFTIAQRAGSISDEDEAAMLLGTSMLVDAIANSQDPRRGWDLKLTGAYSASYTGEGELRFRGSVRSGSTVAGLGFVLDSIQRVPSMEFTDAQFEAARTRVYRELAASFASPGAIFKQEVLSTFHGSPADLLDRIQQRIGRLTRAEVTAALRARIQPAKLVVAVGGDPGGFLDPLSKLGYPVETVDLTIPPPKPPEAKTDPESLEQGRQWLARMQEAMGGAGKLAAVHDYRATTSGLIASVGGVSEIKMIDSWIADSTYRQHQEFAHQEMIFFYNGKIGWVAVGSRLAAMPAFVVDQMRGQVFRLLFRLALSDRDPERIVSYLGSGIVLIQREDGENVRVYIDEETGLPTRIAYRQQQAEGTYVALEDYLDDWRETGGIRLPTKIVTRRGGRQFSNFTLEDIQINSGLRMEDLEKKP